VIFSFSKKVNPKKINNSPGTIGMISPATPIVKKNSPSPFFTIRQILFFAFFMIAGKRERIIKAFSFVVKRYIFYYLNVFKRNKILKNMNISI